MRSWLRVVVMSFAVALVLPPVVSAGTDLAERQYDVLVTFLELTSPNVQSTHQEPNEKDAAEGVPTYRVLSIVTASEIPEQEAEELSLLISKSGFAYASREIRRRIPAHLVQFVDVI